MNFLIWLQFMFISSAEALKTNSQFVTRNSQDTNVKKLALNFNIYLYFRLSHFLAGLLRKLSLVISACQRCCGSFVSQNSWRVGRYYSRTGQYVKDRKRGITATPTDLFNFSCVFTISQKLSQVVVGDQNQGELMRS